MVPVWAERFVVSVLWYIQNPIGHSPEQSCFKLERLNQVLISRNAFQPQQFYEMQQLLDVTWWG